MRAFARKFRTPPALLILFLLIAATTWAAPARPQLEITGYVINADLFPADNRLAATAVVTFTALEDLTAPVFELNNGLQLSKVTDAAKKPLEAERVATNSTIRFTLATPIPKGTTATWTFEYGGTLKGAETSPVEGINFASVQDPISILLYPGRWFPMTGLYTNRFTAEMHIRVPGDERVIGRARVSLLPRAFLAIELSTPLNGPGPDFLGRSSRANFWSPLPHPELTISTSM